MTQKKHPIKWTVKLSGKAKKQLKDLPVKIQAAAFALMKEIENTGPIRRNWKHFGALSKDIYHCHIKGGKPTYVACWIVEDKEIKLVEIYYVGTHEKAPY